MPSRLVLSLLAVAIALAAPWPGAVTTVHAGELMETLPDADDDFLPDSVEWAVLTSATNPDTDGDATPDFVEVVQRGNPRAPGAPAPLDQEMRIVITGPQPGMNGVSWMHLFLRLVDPGTALTSFQAWLELPALPGVRINFDMFSLAPAILRERNAGQQGRWIQLSVPLVSTALLQQILPCSIHAESIVGGRYLRSDVCLFDVHGSIATVVPFDAAHYAVQTLAPVPGGGGLTNRVCLLEFTQGGVGPAGTMYTVSGADCADCNELECVLMDCTTCLGWVITIPGGLGVMTDDG